MHVDMLIMGKGRKNYLRNAQQHYTGIVPTEHTFHSAIKGKNKKAVYEGAFLTANVEKNTFHIMQVLACAKDFSCDHFIVPLTISSHVMERLFLRMCTTDFKVIKPILKTVAVWWDNCAYTKHGIRDGDLCLNINLGTCIMHYDSETEEQIWKTFLHHSQLTDYQKALFNVDIKEQEK